MAPENPEFESLEEFWHELSGTQHLHLDTDDNYT